MQKLHFFKLFLIKVQKNDKIEPYPPSKIIYMTETLDLRDVIKKLETLETRAKEIETAQNKLKVLILSEDNLTTLIKERKKALKLTQQMISDLSGVAKGTVQKIEKGDQQVNLQSFIKVLAVLGIELCLRQK